APGDHERAVTQVGLEALDAAAGRRVHAGVHQVDPPVGAGVAVHGRDRPGPHVDGDVGGQRRVVDEPALDVLALVAEGDDEVLEAEVLVVAHDVPQDRLAADLDHRLRLLDRPLGEPGPEPAGEDAYLHGNLPGRPAPGAPEVAVGWTRCIGERTCVGRPSSASWAPISSTQTGLRTIAVAGGSATRSAGATTGWPDTGTWRPRLWGLMSTAARIRSVPSTVVRNVTPFEPAPHSTTGPRAAASAISSAAASSSSRPCSPKRRAAATIASTRAPSPGSAAGRPAARGSSARTASAHRNWSPNAVPARRRRSPASAARRRRAGAVTWWTCS